MLLDHKNNIELEGIEGAVEAKITTKNLGKILNLITKEQYKDPEGSIVREITSNCFDAHVDAGIDLPVIIDINRDESGEYISFTDSGKGMSPDIMENVYMSYGESTKIHTKEQIGGFGLGGKCPLSYTESYYLTTINEGILYEYIIYRGVELPTYLLLSSNPTDKPSGTTVKIHFVKKDDKYVFINKIKEQLSYFTNIYFKQDYLFSNSFKIIEAEHFKFRNDINDIVKYTYPLQNMHICIGQVFYPIDWSKLNREPIPLPVALKFNINDLIVTPERESLRYVNVNGVSTVDIINSKIDLVLEDFRQRYTKQSNIIVETIDEYYVRLEQKITLDLQGVTFILPESITEGIKQKVHCKKFEGLHEDLIQKFKHIFSYYTITGFNKDYSNKIRNCSTDLDFAYLSKMNVFYSFNNVNSTIKKKYLFENYSKFILGTLNIEYNRILSNFKFRELIVDYTTSRKQQFDLLNKVALEYFKSKCRSFDDFTVPTQYIEAVEAKKIKKKDTEITTYFYNIEKVSYRKTYINTSVLEKFTGIILYGFKEDSHILNNWANLFKKSKYNRFSGGYENSKAIKIFEVAKLNKEHFERLPNSFYITEFMSDNRVFKNIATALLTREETLIDKISINSNILHTANINISDKVLKLNSYLRDFGADAEDVSDRFKSSIIELAKEKDILNHDYLELHREINDYYNGLELLNYINQNNTLSIPYILDYIKCKGKQLNSLLSKPLQYELEIVDNIVNKLEYKLSIVKKTTEYSTSNYYEILEQRLVFFKQIKQFYEYTT